MPQLDDEHQKKKITRFIIRGVSGQ